MHGSLPWDNKFRALLSTPYVTGVVLHDRRCWFEQFEPGRIADPALDAFIRERIRVGADATRRGHRRGRHRSARRTGAGCPTGGPIRAAMRPIR